MNKPTQSPVTPEDEPVHLSKEETDALNRHGVFFKKRVLQELQSIHGIGIVSEELGVSFGGTRVIDIVAADHRSKPQLFFAVECKRAYAAEKSWIFLRDFDRHYRVERELGGMVGCSSIFAQSVPPGPPICSEGYEYRKEKNVADQDPLFKAAGQLSAGYLGFMARREREVRSFGHNAATTERYVPVLVTTAELRVLRSDPSTICLESGNALKEPETQSVNFLILKHPFPTPEGVEPDFRDFPNPIAPPRFWSQLHKESIYVVRSTALRDFLSEENRNALRSAKSED